MLATVRDGGQLAGLRLRYAFYPSGGGNPTEIQLDATSMISGTSLAAWIGAFNQPGFVRYELQATDSTGHKRSQMGPQFTVIAC